MEKEQLEKVLTEVESMIEYHNELQVPIYLSSVEKKRNPEFNDELLNSILKKINEPYVKTNSIDELYQSISNCKKCSLGNTRTNFVFGVGNPNADIVFVGEAPGADEDAQGEPFVGRAGKLLNQILQQVGLKREEIYICNILKCRPPNNRDPLPEEVELCESYLLKQLSLIKPKILVALGRIAGNTLLKKSETLGNLRKTLYWYNGIPFFITFHPAAILRNPQWKDGLVEDLTKMKKYYDELTL